MLTAATVARSSASARAGKTALDMRLERTKERDMEYEYEVYVDKSWMAGGSAASPADALGEADHYALMYANDGDVQVFFYIYTKQIISREDMEAACAS